MSSAADAQLPDHKDGREIEWQLAPTDLGAVRRWLLEHERIEGLVLEPQAALDICDTYLDTDDWRIHRAGFALRLRSASGKSEATLKSLHTAAGAVADRREVSQSLQGSDRESLRQASGPVGSRVRAVSGARALVPLFEVRTSRQRFAVRKERESEQLGEIALDETVISRPDGAPRANMQRVEVEALTESLQPLEVLVKALRDGCALQAARESKYSQGLKSVGLAPLAAPEFAPTTVDCSMTMVEVALASLRRQLSAWNLYEPAARLGDDADALHDLRLAGRRMEAIVRQFRACLPDEFLRARPALKAALRALGEVRDLDVALGELRGFCKDLSGGESEGAEPLRRYLEAQRTQARARMLSVLDAEGMQQLWQRWSEALAQPAAAWERPVPELAVNSIPRLIHRRFKKVCKQADRLRPRSTAAAYHELRGRAKRLRYALEAVAPIYGRPAQEMLRVLRRWQTTLGLQQDAAMASKRLTALAAAPSAVIPAASLFLMGRLAEHNATAIHRSRKRHAKQYGKVRQRYKRLRPRLEAAMVREETPMARGPHA